MFTSLALAYTMKSLAIVSYRSRANEVRIKPRAMVTVSASIRLGLGVLTVTYGVYRSCVFKAMGLT